MACMVLGNAESHGYLLSRIGEQRAQTYMSEAICEKVAAEIIKTPGPDFRVPTCAADVDGPTVLYGGHGDD
jgi:hypothetical protein